MELASFRFSSEVLVRDLSRLNNGTNRRGGSTVNNHRNSDYLLRCSAKQNIIQHEVAFIFLNILNLFHIQSLTFSFCINNVCI